MNPSCATDTTAAADAGQGSVKSLRRGSCPGIADPMPTGDGLLARLSVAAPISIAEFIALCAASQEHGNGIMEVTQRGSLQVRGLSAASAPAFARCVAALGLGEENGPPIITSPLLGLQIDESSDLHGFRRQLKQSLSDRPYLAALGPKVSVLIDGGGKLNAYDLAADIRLRAAAGELFHLALGGNARTAIPLGWVAPAAAAAVIDALLARIAARGQTARARDINHLVDLAELRASLPELIDLAPPPVQPSADPVGEHLLSDGRVAQGIALAFGFASAPALERLARRAAELGADSLRPAPGRSLLAVGLPRGAAAPFAGAALEEGFIARPDDPRRYVMACAGAPACASAMLPTRELAPALARVAGHLLDESAIVHLSGCSKGCAHPKQAALTIVGPGQVILGGRAADLAQGSISPLNLIAGMERLNAEHHRQRRADEPGAAVFSRMGTEQVLQHLGAEKWRG